MQCEKPRGNVCNRDRGGGSRRERKEAVRCGGKRAWGGVKIVHDPKLEVLVLVLGHAM